MERFTMVKLDNQAGFGIPITLYIIAGLAIASLLLGGYIKYQGLKIENLKKDNAILTQANHGLQNNLIKEKESCNTGISAYQVALKKCFAQQDKCKEVVIKDCPKVKIVDKSPELDALNASWKE